MTVKVLCVGDLHYHTNNVELSQQLTKKIVAAVKKTKPDFVVFLGDTLHTHEKLFVQPLNEVWRLFRPVSMLAKTFVLIGNHDYINPVQFLTENHGFNVLKEWKWPITIVDKPTFYTTKDHTFVFMPYVPPGRFVEALNTSGEVWEGADAIFSHQEFYGCKMNGEDLKNISTNGDKWEEEYPPVFNGHIHSPQYVDPNIYCIGSAMQQNYGEAYNKRIWLITFDSEGEDCFTYSEIDLKMPRKRTVEVNIKDVEEFSPNEYGNDQLKLTIKGTPEEFKSLKSTRKYKELAKRCFISHKSTESVEKTKEEIKEESYDYRKILFTLIMNSKIQQRMFEEATGETYTTPA